MRIFFWFVVGSILLTLVRPARAQDSLDYNTPATSLTLTQTADITASTFSRWRMSGYIGYHQQTDKGNFNDNLYLTHGLHASFATDYFLGPNWGLGVMIGYQNLAVSSQYVQDPSIPKSPFPRILPLTSLHSFMLTIGPAFSLPISPQLSLDIDLRGGLFYNDAPILGAYLLNSTQNDLLTGTLVATVMPSGQRMRLGFNGAVGLKYRITQQFSLGLAVTNSYSSFGYTKVDVNNYFVQKRANLPTFGVQATVSYRFSPATQRTKAAPSSAPPRPICYPPVLDLDQPNVYEVGIDRQPVFKWRSSAPVYTEGERFTFRLYTLPGNKLLYEKTVSEPQIVWPADLALPDSTGYYFYSIYTSRSDDFEQSCRSEPIVGTFAFFRRTSTAATTRVPANQFTLRLYELRAAPATPAKQSSINNRKRPATNARRTTRSRTTEPPPAAVDSVQSPESRTAVADSAGRAALADSTQPAGQRVTLSDSTRPAAADSTQPVAADSTRPAVNATLADSAQLAAKRTGTVSPEPLTIKTIPILVYEGTMQQPIFSWPASLSPPAQPAVYQYIISRIGTRAIVQNQYIMVEPDGCTAVIGEGTKNRRLQQTMATKEQPEAKPAPGKKP